MRSKLTVLAVCSAATAVATLLFFIYVFCAPKPPAPKPRAQAVKPLPPPAPVLNVCLPEATTKAAALKKYQDAAAKIPTALEATAIGNYNLGVDQASAVYADAERDYQSCLATALAPQVQVVEDPCAEAGKVREEARTTAESDDKAAANAYQEVYDDVAYLEAEYEGLVAFKKADPGAYAEFLELEAFRNFDGSVKGRGGLVSYYAEERLRKISPAFKAFYTGGGQAARKHFVEVKRLAELQRDTETRGRKNVEKAQAAYDVCLAAHRAAAPKALR